jgi:hypothetical protein
VSDGRVYHQGLRIGLPEIAPDLLVQSRGSVGLDKTLDLYVDAPGILVNRKELQVKTAGLVHLRVTGTVDNPFVTEAKDGSANNTKERP